MAETRPGRKGKKAASRDEGGREADGTGPGTAGANGPAVPMRRGPCERFPTRIRIPMTWRAPAVKTPNPTWTRPTWRMWLIWRT